MNTMMIIDKQDEVSTEGKNHLSCVEIVGDWVIAWTQEPPLPNNLFNNWPLIHYPCESGTKWNFQVIPTSIGAIMDKGEGGDALTGACAKPPCGRLWRDYV